MLVGLNIGESDNKVKDFAKKHHLTYPQLAGATSQRYSSGLPTTVVFTKDGDEWADAGQHDGAATHGMLTDTIDLMYAELAAAEKNSAGSD
jgi:hypothetical protein